MTERKKVRVTAVIPTLNEVRTVGEVVHGCCPYVDKVLVADGGSIDGTCEVAAASGAEVIRLGHRGRGLAIRYVIATDSADILVFIDADGSHIPADIPLVLRPILRDEADLVIACRLTGGSDELDHDFTHVPRAIGSMVLQALVNRCCRVRLTDIQNGFRAIRTAVARDLDLRQCGFCIDQEMAIKCLRLGYRVSNVPSHEFRRCYGRSRLRLWALWPQFVWNVAVSLVKTSDNLRCGPNMGSFHRDE